MAVSLSQIVMSYPGTLALDQVSAEFRFDEVHGLIGENGAGKTTLVSILGGSKSPTSGTITIDGAPVKLTSAGDALRKGIAHVSQEGSLVPGVTGAENILLGDEPRLGLGVIDKRKLLSRACELLRRWFPQVSIDLDQQVDMLPMADQKIIEIVRALRGDVRLLILDEPTATLPAREKESLWEIIRTLPQQGVGIVLISHFLSEIKALSDRITVLRDGRHVATLRAAEASEAGLIDLMLQRTGGKTAMASESSQNRSFGPVVLEVSDWRAGNVEVDKFSIRAGEIVGLIGLTGAGHFGFARSLYAGSGVTSGSCRFRGDAIARIDARSMQKKGVALVPDHRMEYSLIGDWDVRENLAMVHPSFAAMGGTGVLSMRREAQEADRTMQLLNVKAHSRNQFVKDLSGGNKQKVSIGKWLYGADDHYRLMIFIEPTEGVDIGAKREIHAQMRRLADKGVAILVTSSDLLEIADVADRVIPFVNGSTGAEIPREAFSEAKFIAAMAGVIQ
ncbi:sugar ABC transporter ATP-binding protein [Brucella intermedia]|uniref:Ribose import ATP-binding protein rbsA 2 n=2 Tax=Brucella intermedia TaxID=94625 RepID=C4WQ69_9HYPH|nr:sugar ABC transporter ATP-binding protein [Brucella intermedia]PJT25030.1 sugar ABC transporter ATP-binding protein [Ochrobactrum sp. 30A/1000/2015]PJT40480.1 sugar ABC transporter ATP-binding protein [Ochrobactrum sp. 27A/999/2015]PJT42883.1 sugar ABC transporter ATP-binding protein [Ochrobactrum sp. 23A/997/2015]EEQ94412.1 Ribose import ATP-binding protein rbsA 2 [Brucella intermedia LMG 3301]ELT47016.1 ABC transporter-like protein [Brucella intermedia M86]